MFQERIYLDPSDGRVYIDAYVPDLKTTLRPAILVIPGGGYSCVCTDREGEPIAMEFMALGYTPFVLNYRVGKPGDVYPKQLLDASRAMVHIRENAEKFHIDPHRVFATGFSAGGHLAGALATMYGDVTDALGIEEGKNRPDGVALGYPVVTLYGETHFASFGNLLGKKDGYTEEEKLRHSLDKRVNAASSPMYLMHTAEDALVPVAGTLRLAEAAIRAGVPCQLDIFPYGPHGIATAKEVTRCGNDGFVQPIAADWIARADRFFRTLCNQK